ncbi:hypothetical protein [Roseibium aggregatum]|uniref:Uncharacterized protein n=1 Tax=Roseibium aggregatum TaxID=187304 RepID=A0A0M6Y8P0_9HYPH|nr:hypothetical protein [Roseibium aggregatum]CTQ45779.1 hypothetical protein LAL4801_04234 [Roseibium aggregatum]
MRIYVKEDGYLDSIHYPFVEKDGTEIYAEIEDQSLILVEGAPEPENGLMRWDFEEGKWLEPSPEVRRAAMPSLTKKAFKFGLIDNDIDPALIDSYIDSIADQKERMKARVNWDDTTTVSRTDEMVVAISASPEFNLSPEQVDAMWSDAYQNYMAVI